MNPVQILYALSISCLVSALAIACFVVYDWQRLRRGLREDTELDHWPVRGSPDWLRNRHNNQRKP